MYIDIHYHSDSMKSKGCQTQLFQLFLKCICIKCYHVIVIVTDFKYFFYSHPVVNDVNVELYWSESYNRCAPSALIWLSVFPIMLIIYQKSFHLLISIFTSQIQWHHWIITFQCFTQHKCSKISNAIIYSRHKIDFA